MENEKHTLKKLLKGLTSLKDLKDIFSLLGFNIQASDLYLNIESTKIAEIIDSSQIIASHGEYNVIYVKINKASLNISDERLIIKNIKKNHPYAFFVFSNETDDLWHFVNTKTIETSLQENSLKSRKKKIDIRHIAQRITIGPEEREFDRLRTATERLYRIKLEAELTPIELQKLLDEAFNVQRVTEDFYIDYHQLFEHIKDSLIKQAENKKWAHDFALQLLNRIMLLHFVQKKQWLGNDPDFMNSFWKAYKKPSNEKDTFYSKWLEVMFFTAFNRKWQNIYPYFPEEIKTALSEAPFLNGGLFTENELDKKYKGKFLIDDNQWSDIYDFFNSYNFTIVEDTPLDQEVAVDPEMIGHVYESLVNLTGYEERKISGIFYTPQTEIDLMCRLSVSDYLINHLGDRYRNNILEFVFAIDDEEKSEADEVLKQENLVEKINDLINKITILDPACGSGSFLVGMLSLLYDLSRRTGDILGEEKTAYNRKRQIIRESLYGVDIKKWAVDIAELRLWLQLLIDTEIKKEERHLLPLLPNLDFKIRIGDSLVQEVAGFNLSHYQRGWENLPPEIKGRIKALKGEKFKHYNNDVNRKFKTPDDIKHEEIRIFKSILDYKITQFEKEIQEHKKLILTEENHLLKDQEGFERNDKKNDLKEKVTQLENDVDQLRLTRNAFLNIINIPFVWDIAFVEIFEDEKNGFDIVIGNPPYVRQEKISAPVMPDGRQITTDKQEYKLKLMNTVYSIYPDFFKYKKTTKKAGKKLDGKSDYYIFFYFISLSLLNREGSFSFITSNSWLDVGYGKDLQEFLIKTTDIKLILDNKVKRSFTHADVNTIITLFGKPYTKRETDFEKYVRFVMFEIPFEGAFSSVLFEEIIEATEKKRTPEYKVFPKTYKSLLLEGAEMVEKESESEEKVHKSSISIGPLIKTTKYLGNKWGGKYLRAPDIYWTILEKGKGKLVRLGDIAKVRFGIKTGANEFFYLKPLGPPDKNGLVPVRNGAGWEGEIEEKFLKPVIKSPRECRSILIKPEYLKYKIFMCNKDKNELNNTKALDYILWGEEKNKVYHKRPSCKGRINWFNLGFRDIPPIICPGNINEYVRTFYNTGVYSDKRLYEVYPNEKYTKKLVLIMNSILTTLFIDIGSRSGLGEGLIDLTVYELADCQILNPIILKENSINIFNSVKEKSLSSYEDEIITKERKDIETLILSELRLSDEEIDELYLAVGLMIKSRLQKAENYK